MEIQEIISRLDLQLKDLFLPNKNIISLAGSINCERALFICENCQTKHYPLDEENSVVSKKFAKASTMISFFVPFGHRVKILEELRYFHVSETMLMKVNQKIGGASL